MIGQSYLDKTVFTLRASPFISGFYCIWNLSVSNIKRINSIKRLLESCADRRGISSTRNKQQIFGWPKLERCTHGEYIILQRRPKPVSFVAIANKVDRIFGRSHFKSVVGRSSPRSSDRRPHEVLVDFGRVNRVRGGRAQSGRWRRRLAQVSQGSGMCARSNEAFQFKPFLSMFCTGWRIGRVRRV